MKHNLVVLIPIYKQYVDLTASEKKSLCNTYKVLGKYDIAFVTHAGIDTTAYYLQQEQQLNVQTFTFDSSYFTGLVSYSNLLLSLDFYACFRTYDYILVCQLDVFVFTDQLDYFINKGYDYIGAPWFKDYDAATAESPIIGVGNGGFSLRKTKSFLEILYAVEILSGRKPTVKVLQAVTRHWIDILRIVKHEYHRRKRAYEAPLPWQTPLYEDGYWGLIAPVFFPWFTVGSVPDAIAFAFEVNPSILYELNQKQLPMATHAWEKYDPGFWKQFIHD